MADGRALRVMIVDDQAVVRLGFQALLDSQPDISVVAVAADGREAVQFARTARPDVVLMDVRMPVMGGIDATRALQELPNPPHVLILTTFDLDEYVYEALRAGASGFLLKDATPEQILDAVRVIGAGDALLAPAVTRRLITEFAARAELQTPAAVDRPHAARAGGIRPARYRASQRRDRRTVTPGGADGEDPRQRRAVKLGLRDRVQAVVLAYESGIITPGAGRTTAQPVRSRLTLR